MKTRIHLYSLFCIALIPLHANANSCRQLTNTINNDLAKYEGNIKNQHLEWMSIVWLQQQLGTADKKNATGSQTKYQWRCEPDGSYLVAVVDTNGNLLRVSGQYNSDNGSGLFAARIPKSEVSFDAIKPEMKTSTPQLMPANIAATNIADRISQYNDHYKTTFQTSLELENDMIQRIKHYYSNLRFCQPGTYEFALPVLQDFLYNTAVIISQKEGRCQVKTSYVIPQIGKIDLKCNYQPQNLQLYTDAEAEAAARGTTQFDSEHPSAIQMAVEKDCKRYVDGVP